MNYQIAALLAVVPVKRLGRRGTVVGFFADPANGSVTGQVLYACGCTRVGSLTL